MAFWDTERLKERAADAAAWAHEAAVRRPAVAGVVGVGALLAVVGLVWWLASGPAPSPAEDPTALARFIAGPQFEKLPAEQKRPYMKSARKQMAQIEALRREEKLDRNSYRSAYLAARME